MCFTSSFTSEYSFTTKLSVSVVAGGLLTIIVIIILLLGLRRRRCSCCAVYDVKGNLIKPGGAMENAILELHFNLPHWVTGSAGSNVNGYAADKLDQALDGVQVVVIPAGVPRQARQAGVYDPKRVFGVTTLDVVRTAHFTASLASTHPDNTPITVDGGHSSATMVHPLSQSTHGKGIEHEAYEKLVHCIQFGEDKVVKAKHGAGSVTLSMAYAGAKFANAVLCVLNSEKGVITPMFDHGINFLSSNVQLGVNDVQEIFLLGELSLEEQKLLEACLPELKKNIELCSVLANRDVDFP
ncbi:hypothetical protein SCLCIDRAFT_1175164 [Scleroderma citrinum Foug A]|uniref:malate dehydrogenase n=1 Tax=Scleroderma citrinum Foug A TaxID=1036808 RepID=A0A0C3CPZ4_9AGAM|nr:hypothetical protein SCLCIDRAFT_1175164 [Scleroderma citrinum Foug A]